MSGGNGNCVAGTGIQAGALHLAQEKARRRLPCTEGHGQVRITRNDSALSAAGPDARTYRFHTQEIREMTGKLTRWGLLRRREKWALTPLAWVLLVAAIAGLV